MEPPPPSVTIKKLTADIPVPAGPTVPTPIEHRIHRTLEHCADEGVEVEALELIIRNLDELLVIRKFRKDTAAMKTRAAENRLVPVLYGSDSTKTDDEKKK